MIPELIGLCTVWMFIYLLRLERSDQGLKFIISEIPIRPHQNSCYTY